MNGLGLVHENPDIMSRGEAITFIGEPSGSVDDQQASAVKTLREMRDQTLARIESVRHRLRDQPEAGSADEGDGADQAFDLYDRSQMAWLIQNLEVKAHQLNLALERALEGGYGVCSRCHQPIPSERLELVPETTLCVSCASAHERTASREAGLYAARANRAAARYAAEAVDDERE